jgi:hypothetical protein
VELRNVTGILVKCPNKAFWQDDSIPIFQVFTGRGEAAFIMVAGAVV